MMRPHHAIFDRDFHALRSGECPEIHDYLDLAPEADRAELLRDMAFEEMCWRIPRGEAAGADEILTRFPDLKAAEEARCRRQAAPTVGATTARSVMPPEAGPEIPGYGPLERLG